MSQTESQRSIDTNAFARFIECMPVDNDETLAVLKAHLLVEEQLWRIVLARLASRSELIRRIEKQCKFLRDIALIAETLVSPEDIALSDAQWVWLAIDKLNSLRNDLAHNLEPVGVDKRISELVNCVSTPQERSGDLRKDFYMAAFLICFSLEQLRQPIGPGDF